MRRSLAVLSALLALFVLPAAAQQPGTLISAEPMQATPAGVQAWKILY